VKTENPSACATVNWKLCISAIAPYCLHLTVFVKEGASKFSKPKQSPLFSSRLPPYT
jgi:hypothetical protein